MVNLLGKRDNGLAYVKKSLEDNLKINSTSSRLVDINNSIVNNRYRIKDLDSKSFNAITQGFISYVIDNKLFVFATNISSWVVEVFDIFTLSLITTINTGGQASCVGLDYDNEYIYIPKILISGSTRTVKIMKYSRCTLSLITESPTIYTANVAIIISAVLVNNGFAYIGINISGSGFIVKVNLSDYTTSQTNYSVPVYFVKISETIFIATGNGTLSSDANYRKPQLLDYNLNVVQYLPTTLLTTNQTRYVVKKDDYLYVANDSGVLTKYQISTNTIIKEIVVTNNNQIRGLQIVKNGIFVQNNLGTITLYDFDLNFVKSWGYYNTTTAGGFMTIDDNSTIYTHSYNEPKFYKKQFIDMTEGVV